MRIKLELLGTYRDKLSPNHVVLEFDGAPTVQAIIVSGINYFRNHNKFIDENFINVAVDGRIIPSSAWHVTRINAGQKCILFPPIQGG